MIDYMFCHLYILEIFYPSSEIEPSQKYKIFEHSPKYSVWTLLKNTKYKIQFPKSLNTFQNILYGPFQKCPTGFFDNEFWVIIKKNLLPACGRHVCKTGENNL